MAPRTTPPFRADHVGSLLRPPDLHRARADYAAGTITAAQLRAAEDEAVREAVRMQEEIGRLCISPQCGFASTVDGNVLTQAQQRAKLSLVAQTAADLWGS